MKRTMILPVFAACLILFASCTENPKQETTVPALTAAVPDVAQVRADIQTLENKWADGLNSKNVDVLMDLYAEDAVSMPDGEPTLTGKAAIRAAQEKQFAAQTKPNTVSFETVDVYVAGDVITEVGKSTNKDAEGKVTGTGKYIAIFEKQGDKFLCIREIYNKDSKK